MLSGLKFISRDQFDTVQQDDLDASRKGKKKSNKRKEKDRRRKKSSKYSSSEDDLERVQHKSRKKKKWYSSNEDLTMSSGESESESSSDPDKKKHSNSTKRSKRKYEDNSEDESYGGGFQAKDIARKEVGLEWMLRPKDNVEREPETTREHQPEETPAEEIKRIDSRELNPYLKHNGRGYPENVDGKKADGNQLLSSSFVGDGGVSWRLKALKRAQEQAAREGRKLDEVVEDRWGSLGQLTVSVASQRAAPSYSHLHAIKNRKMGLKEGQQNHADNQHERVTEENNVHERPEKASVRHPQMKVPKLHDSLSWGKRKDHDVSTKDSGIISSAMSSINKFNNDGSFMREVMCKQSDDSGGSLYTNSEKKVESQMPSEDDAVIKQALSANQLAAKALQLRMRGKHEEAENLLKEVENIKVKVTARDLSSRSQNEVSTGRYIVHDISVRQKKKEEDADMHLARKIVKNQQYSIAGRADDEYDFDDGSRRKTRKKGGANEHKSTETTGLARRILTQKERCQFCFENPTRPRHLVIAVANSTYLSLPHWEPIVPGHCCILPMQHDSATRTVDNNVWDEIRNFKKCLIMMFAKQEKSLVFLETVMGLAQQRRHCLVDCVPLPQEIAKQAPLYFKKAIDEAEDEWSQHNAKKLIDTSEKGLRASIPKDFPYFHVEFGLDKGFVHVIDDEQQFKSNFGPNVIRGMLSLLEQDRYRRRKHESVESQKQAVASFARDWEPFDWTKQLD